MEWVNRTRALAIERVTYRDATCHYTSMTPLVPLVLLKRTMPRDLTSTVRNITVLLLLDLECLEESPHINVTAKMAVNQEYKRAYSEQL